jgi:hypothetical protein
MNSPGSNAAPEPGVGCSPEPFITGCDCRSRKPKMVVGVVERRCRVEVQERQITNTVGPCEESVVLLDGAMALFLGAREHDRDRVQVISGQTGDPMFGGAIAGVP